MTPDKMSASADSLRAVRSGGAAAVALSQRDLRAPGIEVRAEEDGSDDCNEALDRGPLLARGPGGLLWMAQRVPARLLREIALALGDLAYVGQHGGAWEQRIAREGRAAVVVAARERGTAAAVGPDSRREPEEHQQGDTP